MSNIIKYMIPLFMLIGGLGIYLNVMPPSNPPPGKKLVQIGGPFTLTDHNGVQVTEKDILDKPQLIYFGFTYCLDICPTALFQLGEAMEQVDPDGMVFQPILISVDPERDTPDQMKAYVSSTGFPPNLWGLTGTVEQIEQAKKGYRIFAKKAPMPDSESDYMMDHVSVIYLVSSEGQLFDTFSHSTSVREMVERLQAFKETHFNKISILTGRTKWPNVSKN